MKREKYVFHCCCEPDATEERDSTKTRVYSSPVHSTVVGALCEYVFHCCCEPDTTEERDSTKTRVYSSPVRSTVVGAL